VVADPRKAKPSKLNPVRWSSGRCLQGIETLRHRTDGFRRAESAIEPMSDARRNGHPAKKPPRRRHRRSRYHQDLRARATGGRPPGRDARGRLPAAMPSRSGGVNFSVFRRWTDRVGAL